ncbi:MAG: hypothetical protein K6U11_11090 [bacterium]|nr:hypothetical protein [bacterium]
MTDREIGKLLHGLEAEVETLRQISSTLHQLLVHEGKLELLFSELATVSDEIIFLRKKLDRSKSRWDLQLDFKLKSLLSRLDRLEMSERMQGSPTWAELEERNQELAKVREDLTARSQELFTIRDHLKDREKELSEARAYLEEREREVSEYKKRIRDLEAELKRLKRPWWRKLFPVWP